MNAVEIGLAAKLNATVGLTALLAAAPTGVTRSIYNTRVPQAANYPLVVFQYYSGGDDNETPNRARSLVYIVKGISDVSLKEAGAISDQIDATLHMQTLTISGWVNYLTRHEGDLEELESAPGGKTFFHVGGLYRIRIDQ